MPHYRYHVFVCVHEREDGSRACKGGAIRDYAKKRINALGLDSPGACRINSAGCLGRCDEGPLLVVYPQGIWYAYIDEQDVDDIINEHLLHDRIVERLRLP